MNNLVIKIIFQIKRTLFWICGYKHAKINKKPDNKSIIKTAILKPWISKFLLASFDYFIDIFKLTYK